MSIEEKYFAFMEHEGQIELNYWAKTKEEARTKAQEWADFSAKNLEQNVSFGVAEIIETIEGKVLIKNKEDDKT